MEAMGSLREAQSITWHLREKTLAAQHARLCTCRGQELRQGLGQKDADSKDAPLATPLARDSCVLLGHKLKPPIPEV